MTTKKNENEQEFEKNGEVELTVRTYDPETGEFLDCSDYTVHDIPESIARKVEQGNFDDIFPYLFEEYSYDFPDEEPGVNAEIDNWNIDWNTFK